MHTSQVENENAYNQSTEESLSKRMPWASERRLRHATISLVK